MVTMRQAAAEQQQVWQRDQFFILNEIVWTSPCPLAASEDVCCAHSSLGDGPSGDLTGCGGMCGGVEGAAVGLHLKVTAARIRRGSGSGSGSGCVRPEHRPVGWPVLPMWSSDKWWRIPSWGLCSLPPQGVEDEALTWDKADDAGRAH